VQVTLGQLTDAEDNFKAASEADSALTCAQSNAASLQVRLLCDAVVSDVPEIV
jgi:hypothetical protein